MMIADSSLRSLRFMFIICYLMLFDIAGLAYSCRWSRDGRRGWFW